VCFSSSSGGFQSSTGGWNPSSPFSPPSMVPSSCAIPCGRAMWNQGGWCSTVTPNLCLRCSRRLRAFRARFLLLASSINTFLATSNTFSLLSSFSSIRLGPDVSPSSPGFSSGLQAWAPSSVLGTIIGLGGRDALRIGAISIPIHSCISSSTSQISSKVRSFSKLPLRSLSFSEPRKWQPEIVDVYLRMVPM
jgi:hypothetical protein